MKYLYHLIIKYPLSCLLLVVIWYLCFFTPPETKLNEVDYIDKWTHIVMYLGTCSVIWIEYLKRHTKVEWTKAILLAWLAPILMSVLIELLQAHCTNGRRSGEWLDVAANSIGVTLALVIGTLVARYHGKA